MAAERSFDFRSDNVAGVAPEVLSALAEAAKGSVTSYGEDPITQRVEARLKELFGHELTLFTVATGSAANALALAHVNHLVVLGDLERIVEPGQPLRYQSLTN